MHAVLTPEEIDALLRGLGEEDRDEDITEVAPFQKRGPGRKDTGFGLGAAGERRGLFRGRGGLQKANQEV